MATAYIGVGSNLGNRKNNIEKSFQLLLKSGLTIEKKASIIETLPVGGPAQENYLNTVIKINTLHSAQELLKVLNKIENLLGRVRSVKNAPRTIDLDILLYNNDNINTDTLTVPHPRMFERRFVLDPLIEIEPELAAKLINENCLNNSHS